MVISGILLECANSNVRQPLDVFLPVKGVLEILPSATGADVDMAEHETIRCTLTHTDAEGSWVVLSG